jgi:hypothetical protein
MSATATSPVFPPFYHRIVGVDPTLHADLRLDRTPNFGFAAGADYVPLGLVELDAAAQHYPILFTKGADPAPIALLGLRNGQNLFVMPDGRWRDGSYVPAYCRAFPFIFVGTGTDETTYVAMEADAACLRRDAGEPLFADGKPTPSLSQAIAFCDNYRNNVIAAEAFGRALAAHGLLEDETATVNFTGGGSLRVAGFQVVRPERLENVADATFLDWRRRGWIPSLYAHLFSLGRWAQLIDFAAARGEAPPRQPGS